MSSLKEVICKSTKPFQVIDYLKKETLSLQNGVTKDSVFRNSKWTRGYKTEGSWFYSWKKEDNLYSQGVQTGSGIPSASYSIRTRASLSVGRAAEASSCY
jgi:hypothetical protein